MAVPTNLSKVQGAACVGKRKVQTITAISKAMTAPAKLPMKTTASNILLLRKITALARRDAI
jgi:hypothetical protein